MSLVSGRTRPTPPNTLNLKCSNSPATSDVLASCPSHHVAKTPPPPPPRWAKPVAGQQNFTVTTTVTFSLHKESSPAVSPCGGGHHTSKSTDDSEITPAATVKSPPGSEIMSPVSDTGGVVVRSGRRTKRNRIKQSRHYRESDILETPNVYHRSAFADKFSDYEDVWGPDSSLSTFKTPSSSLSNSGGTYKKSVPELPPDMPPDILEQTSKNALSVLVLPQSPPGQNDLPSITDSTTSLLTPGTPEEAARRSPAPDEDVVPEAAKQGSPFYAEPADAIKQV